MFRVVEYILPKTRHGTPTKSYLHEFGIAKLAVDLSLAGYLGITMYVAMFFQRLDPDIFTIFQLLLMAITEFVLDFVLLLVYTMILYASFLFGFLSLYMLFARLGCFVAVYYCSYVTIAELKDEERRHHLNNMFTIYYVSIVLIACNYFHKYKRRIIDGYDT